MVHYESSGRDEHAARTARAVKDAPVTRLNNFRQQSNDGRGGVKLATALTFGHGELAKEVFIDAPEGVVIEAGGNLGNLFQQFLEEGAGKQVVGLGQDTGELPGRQNVASLIVSLLNSFRSLEQPVVFASQSRRRPPSQADGANRYPLRHTARQCQ